jgi:hypothetical protein
MTTENVLLRLRNFFLQFIFWHNLWLPSIKKKIFPMIGKQSTLKLSKVKWTWMTSEAHTKVCPHTWNDLLSFKQMDIQETQRRARTVCSFYRPFPDDNAQHPGRSTTTMYRTYSEQQYQIPDGINCLF